MSIDAESTGIRFLHLDTPSISEGLCELLYTSHAEIGMRERINLIVDGCDPTSAADRVTVLNLLWVLSRVGYRKSPVFTWQWTLECARKCARRLKLNKQTRTDSIELQKWAVLFQHLYEYHEGVRLLESIRSDDDDTWLTRARLYGAWSISDRSQLSHAFACLDKVKDPFKRPFTKGLTHYQLGRHRDAESALREAHKSKATDFRANTDDKVEERAAFKTDLEAIRKVSSRKLGFTRRSDS